MRAHGNIDFHARRHAITQHLDHRADRLHALGRRLDDAHRHHLVVFGAVSIGFGYTNVVGDTGVVGHHVAYAALFHETTDHALVDALQHFGNAPFPASAMIAADNTHHGPIAMHEQAHLARIEEDVVLLAVVGDEKAEPIAMPLHASAYQVHLVERAECAAAVFQQLAVAQHGAQAMLESFGGLVGQRIQLGELGPGHRASGLGQIVEYQLAAGHRFGVAAFFVFELRIAVAPVGATARFLIQDFAPYARTIPQPHTCTSNNCLQ